MGELISPSSFAHVGPPVGFQEARGLEGPLTVVTLVGPLSSMAAHVVAKVGRVLVGLPTHLAGERSLACVPPHVALEVLLLREGLATLGATVRPLPGVDAHVVLECVFVREDLMADRAGRVLRRPLMGQLVPLQVGHVDEGAPAHAAQELALTLVVTAVALEQRGGDKAPSALLALVRARRRVVALVHAQLKGTGEPLGAVRAGEEVLVVVARLVDLQVTTLREALATHGALEGLFSCVRALVVAQVDPSEEGLVADIALEWPHPSVCVPVVREVGEAGEEPPTLGALKRPLIRVSALVSLQLPSKAVGLTAL